MSFIVLITFKECGGDCFSYGPLHDHMEVIAAVHWGLEGRPYSEGNRETREVAERTAHGLMDQFSPPDEHACGAELHLTERDGKPYVQLYRVCHTKRKELRR